MAFDLKWKFEIADCASSLDITSFVFNASVDLQSPMGETGRSNAQLTINNYSGQFTPNGTGTYAAVNWFAKALVVRASSVSTSQDNVVFVGMITDFKITNDSLFQSTLTIRADDYLTITGRSNSENIGPKPFPFTDPSVAVMIENVVNGLFGVFTSVPRPTLNGGSSIDAITRTSEVTVVNQDQLVPQSRVSDWINNQIVPTMPGTVFCDTYISSALNFSFKASVIDKTLNRTSNKKTFTFVASSPTSGQIPYNTIDIDYNLETLTNSAQTACTANSFTGSSVNSASTNLYGVRSRQYSQLATPGTVFVNNLQPVADYWTARYSDVTYIPQRLETSYSVLRGSAVDDGVALASFIDLLSAETALWNQIGCSYKTVGMSATATIGLIATKRTIFIDPIETSVILGVVSGADNQNFELDNTYFGVLDQNRLG